MDKSLLKSLAEDLLACETLSEVSVALDSWVEGAVYARDHSAALYVRELVDFVEELKALVGDYSVHGKKLADILDQLTYPDNLFAWGDDENNLDAYTRLDGISEKLEYDNGLPLTGFNYPPEDPTEVHYFFEDDEDSEHTALNELDNMPVVKFTVLGNGFAYCNIDKTPAELASYIRLKYDGYPYEVDLPRFIAERN